MKRKKAGLHDCWDWCSITTCIRRCRCENESIDHDEKRNEDIGKCYEVTNGAVEEAQEINCMQYVAVGEIMWTLAACLLAYHSPYV